MIVAIGLGGSGGASSAKEGRKQKESRRFALQSKQRRARRPPASRATSKNAATWSHGEAANQSARARAPFNWGAGFDPLRRGFPLQGPATYKRFTRAARSLPPLRTFPLGAVFRIDPFDAARRARPDHVLPLFWRAFFGLSHPNWTPARPFIESRRLTH